MGLQFCESSLSFRRPARHDVAFHEIHYKLRRHLDLRRTFFSGKFARVKVNIEGWERREADEWLEA